MLKKSHASFLFASALSIGLLLSCQFEQNRQITEKVTKPYFDISGYFNQQIAKLQRDNPFIHKTVSKNGDAEEKNVKIAKWKTELSFFITSDINKPDWYTLYRIDSSENRIIYTANDPTLRTKKIVLNKSAKKEVISIFIDNEDNNLLYRSSEHLSYYPDSLYRIEKKQDVRFLNKNIYLVEGTF